jgi:hypothetical protein
VFSHKYEEILLAGPNANKPSYEGGAMRYQGPG